MAGLLPSYIYREAALRIGAYPGIPSAIEALYVAVDPTLGMKSESFVPSSFKDSLRAVEQEIAGAVATPRVHPWQNVIADVTAAIASGVLVPVVGASSATAKVIGNYGQVRDGASPFRPLTNDLPVSEIRALNQNPGTMFKSDVFSYQFDRGRLVHTRPTATVDVCVYDFEARKTAIDANAELLFTEAENAYLSGLMSMLMNTDALLTELANQYSPRYQAWLAAFRSGQTELPKAA